MTKDERLAMLTEALKQAIDIAETFSFFTQSYRDSDDIPEINKAWNDLQPLRELVALERELQEGKMEE